MSIKTEYFIPCVNPELCAFILDERAYSLQVQCSSDYMDEFDKIARFNMQHDYMTRNLQTCKQITTLEA